MRTGHPKKRLSAALAVLLLAAAAVFPASANSAIRDWAGTDGIGPLLTDGECPVEVTHESLVLTLDTLPARQDNAGYTARVTAAYDLYNPTDTDVTVSLAFPFGILPSYPTGFDFTGFPDAASYDVTVNGQTVEKTLRHTYGGSQFDLDRDLPRLRDGYAADPFFTPDMTVTVYTVSPEQLPGTDDLPVEMQLDVVVTEQPGTMLYFSQGNETIDLGGGRWRHTWIRHANDMTEDVIFCAIGRPLEHSPEVRLYEGTVDTEKYPLDVPVGVTEKTITLIDFFRQTNRSVEADDRDLFNAVMDHWDTLPGTDGFILRQKPDVRGCLLCWYTYEVTIPAHGTVRNTVTAPMYPDIDEGMEPPVYTYTYLLSPASTWADFGTLDVEIVTPYYLSSPSLEGFEKTDTGWRLCREGLPSGELTFSLCESEKPRREKTAWGTALVVVIVVVVLVVPAVAAGTIVGLVFLIRAIVRRARRKKQMNADK